MKKRIKSLTVFLLVLGLLGTMVIGCGDAGNVDKEAKDTPKDEPINITISGSTSVQPHSEVLAQAFMKKNEGVQVYVQGGGSSAGIKAVVEGAADIGSASRNLKSSEEGQGLVTTVIAKDGIAVVVHPSNKISDLSVEQIKGIYEGTITNWKEVGGEDLDIDVVCREEGSGTRAAFEDMVMDKQKIIPKAIIQGSNGAVRSTVAGDEKAIGFISLATVNDSVKAIDVEGVKATAENILAGTYKISRPFLYITKGEPTGGVKKFIDFVLSSEGQALLEKGGCIPVK